MGIMVGLPSPSGSEKDLQLNFGKNMTVQVEMRAPYLPAEWHTQSGHTTDVAARWYGLGIYAGRSTAMFHKYRPRNSKTGTVTNRHSRT